MNPDDLRATLGLLETLPRKRYHDVMVPLPLAQTPETGPVVGFVPARIHDTNDVLIRLGSATRSPAVENDPDAQCGGYFARVTPYQAQQILLRRAARMGVDLRPAAQPAQEQQQQQTSQPASAAAPASATSSNSRGAPPVPDSAAASDSEGLVEIREEIDDDDSGEALSARVTATGRKGTVVPIPRDALLALAAEQERLDAELSPAPPLVPKSPQDILARLRELAEAEERGDTSVLSPEIFADSKGEKKGSASQGASAKAPAKPKVVQGKQPKRDENDSQPIAGFRAGFLNAQPKPKNSSAAAKPTEKKHVSFSQDAKPIPKPAPKETSHQAASPFSGQVMERNASNVIPPDADVSPATEEESRRPVSRFMQQRMARG